MKYYLSIDGGGSKCAVLFYDENLNLLGSGEGGGVNTTQNSAESSRQSMVHALDSAFANGAPAEIEMVEGIFIGPFETMLEEISKRTRIVHSQRHYEPRACRIAAVFRGDGLVALSGTGSDVFYIHEQSNTHLAVGGWGPILGDEGSGAWIGWQALQAVVRAHEGWGEPTLLGEYLMQDWNMQDLHEAISIVYHNPAPLRQAGTATRTLSRAAHAGDKVAQEILREAGRMMALQMQCLLKKYPQIPREERQIACVGGAWKAHPCMEASFRQYMQQFDAAFTTVLPAFEPVMAGPVLTLLQQQPQMPQEEMRAFLQSRFTDFVYGR